MKKIGAIISFLLLLIGGAYAEENISEGVAKEDSIGPSGNIINESESVDNTSNVGVDIISNESIDTGNTIVIEDAIQEQTTEKRSSPGFEYLMSFISLLSVVFIIKRKI